MIEEYKRTYRHLVEPSLPGTPIRSPSPINMNTIDHGKKDSVQGSDSELEDAEFVGRYKVPKGYAGHASMGDGYTGFHINDYAVKPHKPSKQKRPQNVIIC